MTKSGRESDVKSRECECLHVGRKLSFRLPRYKSLLSLLQTPKADRRQTAQKLILALANVTVSDGQFNNLSEVQLQRDYLKAHMGQKTDLIPT